MFDFDAILSKTSAAMDEAIAAAKRAAGTAKTGVTVLSLEEKLKTVFQALGRAYYEAQAKGTSIDGAEAARLCAQAEDILRRIDSLRTQDDVSGRKHPDPSPEEPVTDEDFADL